MAFETLGNDGCRQREYSVKIGSKRKYTPLRRDIP